MRWRTWRISLLYEEYEILFRQSSGGVVKKSCPDSCAKFGKNSYYLIGIDRVLSFSDSFFLSEKELLEYKHPWPRHVLIHSLISLAHTVHIFFFCLLVSLTIEHQYTSSVYQPIVVTNQSRSQQELLYLSLKLSKRGGSNQLSYLCEKYIEYCSYVLIE